MGPASKEAASELKALARTTDRWLAVTLSPDHQTDELLTGEIAPATIATWLVAVTGFPLVYLEKYRRNERGQWMWLAILERRAPKFGNSGPAIAPANILRQMSHRGWWATGGFMRQFPSIVPRTSRFYTATAASFARSRYLRHHETLKAYARMRHRAMRARMADDPDFAEAVRLKQRQRAARRRLSGPSRPKAAPAPVTRR